MVEMDPKQRIEIMEHKCATSCATRDISASYIVYGVRWRFWKTTGSSLLFFNGNNA